MSDLHPDEADIEASRAPLLDHLVELRKRLIICVGAIILGFGVCFGFSTQIYEFLLHPFQLAGQIFAAQQQGEAKGPFDLLFVVVVMSFCFSSPLNTLGAVAVSISVIFKCHLLKLV